MSIGQTFEEKYTNFFNFFNQPHTLEEIIDFITKNNIPTNSPYMNISLNMIDSQNLNILFHIIKKSVSDEDCLKKLKTLIEKYNVNYNGFDYIYHRKIPFYTCVKGYLKSTEYLIEKMDFNIRNLDSRGQTIFFSAIKSYNIELMKYLDKKYPNWMFYPDNNFSSCIFMIFKKNMDIDDTKFKELLKYIINKGFDIDEKNNDNISFKDKCIYFKKDALLYEVINEIGGDIAEKYLKNKSDENDAKNENNLNDNKNQQSNGENEINENQIINKNNININNINHKNDINKSIKNDLIIHNNINKKEEIPNGSIKINTLNNLSSVGKNKLPFNNNNEKIKESEEKKINEENKDNIIITNQSQQDDMKNKTEEKNKKDSANISNEDKNIKNNENYEIELLNEKKEKKDFNEKNKNINSSNKGILPINIVNKKNNKEAESIKTNKIDISKNNEKENNISINNNSNCDGNAKNNNQNNVEKNLNQIKDNKQPKKEQKNNNNIYTKYDINNLSLDDEYISQSENILNPFTDQKDSTNVKKTENNDIKKTRCCIFIGRKTKYIKGTLDHNIKQELMKNKKLGKYIDKIKIK